MNSEQSIQKPASLMGVEALFKQFDALYGARFADMWKGSDVNLVKNAWSETLYGFKVGEIKQGLSACRTKPWPPTLPEFLMMCRPPPNFEQAFAEAQLQVSKRDRGDDKWPSKAMYWAAVEFGFYDMRSMAWQTAKSRWTRIFAEKLTNEENLPDVPEKLYALPGVGQSLTDKAAAKKRLADVLAMIKRPPAEPEEVMA